MSTTLKAMFLSTAMVLAGCAHAATPAPAGPAAASAAEVQAPIGVTPRNRIVPVIDAHQHVMGPGALSILALAPPPTAITVPAPLADLLSRREKGVDQASFADLYTPDAQVLAEEHARWWQGEARILDALGNFGSDRRFVPTSYSLDGSGGYVAGLLRAASGEDTHSFVLGLKKGSDGRLRIASEMKQQIMERHFGTSPVTAEKVIEMLDDAGIRYGTILSVAYWYGDPEKQIADRAAGTRAENDWAIAEARKYPDRLIPFCGVNPLDDYAVAELERCAALGVRGMKIHRNSKFDPVRLEDREKLKQFFRAANRHGMAIVLHIRGEAQLWIDHIFPEAPDIPIQVAHMGDWSPAFGEAIQAGKPGTKNLWFDWTQAMDIPDLWAHGPELNNTRRGPYSPQTISFAVGEMRKIGLNRILYGSDMPLAWNPSPRDWWRKTILTLPLTDEEIANIADNLPPYVPQAR